MTSGSWYRNYVWRVKGTREYTKYGYELASSKFDPKDLDIDCNGRHFMITGANSGIGLTTALEIAKRGGVIHLVCRNAKAMKEARSEIITTTGNDKIYQHQVQLSKPKEVAQWAEEFSRTNEKIDVLINNASGLNPEREVDEDNIELTFAVNVMAAHIITTTMIPILRRSDDPRVIIVSSSGMLKVKLEPQDLNFEKLVPYDGLLAYCQTKRQQAVMNLCYAQKYEGIKFFSMHPGWVDTPGLRKSIPTFYEMYKANLRTSYQGADTVIWLAISKKALKHPSGVFFQDRTQVVMHLPLAWTRSSTEDETLLMENLDEIMKRYCSYNLNSFSVSVDDTVPTEEQLNVEKVTTSVMEPETVQTNDNIADELAVAFAGSNNKNYCSEYCISETPVKKEDQKESELKPVELDVSLTTVPKETSTPKNEQLDTQTSYVEADSVNTKTSENELEKKIIETEQRNEPEILKSTPNDHDLIKTMNTEYGVMTSTENEPETMKSTSNEHEIKSTLNEHDIKITPNEQEINSTTDEHEIKTDMNEHEVIDKFSNEPELKIRTQIDSEETKSPTEVEATKNTQNESKEINGNQLQTNGNQLQTETTVTENTKKDELNSNNTTQTNCEIANFTDNPTNQLTSDIEDPKPCSNENSSNNVFDQPNENQKDSGSICAQSDSKAINQSQNLIDIQNVAENGITNESNLSSLTQETKNNLNLQNSNSTEDSIEKSHIKSEVDAKDITKNEVHTLIAEEEINIHTDLDNFVTNVEHHNNSANVESL